MKDIDVLKKMTDIYIDGGSIKMQFKLRKWKHSDAECIVKYANNPKVANNLRNVFPYPYTIDDAKKYINDCIYNDESNQFIRAIVVNEEAVGSIGVFIKDDVYCKSGEIGYWLGEPFWGNGIISEAIKQICSFVFQHSDIIRIFAEPYEYNIGSRKALEKAGFKLEGILKKSVYKNGKIFDSCIYALIK